MIVFTNTSYQSPNAALLHKPVPKPMPVALTALSNGINLPLRPSYPKYDAKGRQLGFDESSLQRCARVEFLKHRTGERRVEEWVKSQLQLTPPPSLPPPRTKRQRFMPPPRMRKFHSSPFHKPRIPSPLSSSCLPFEDQVMYAIPEDSSLPMDEPRIFRQSFEVGAVSPAFSPTSIAQLISPKPKYPDMLTLPSPPHFESDSWSTSPHSPRRPRHRCSSSTGLQEIPEIAGEE
jgi:hypothetical protein